MSQQPPIPPKRERKTIRIRDPNQGGKDITEEIMSGARTSSTPTPPQLEPGPCPFADLGGDRARLGGTRLACAELWGGWGVIGA
uniref:Eukaryotic translation initiation factor 4 gamma 1 n=1 Tax=Nothoprocta perdicaria TaxID=30464 RepID=A0A8C6YRW6_NOTPE